MDEFRLAGSLLCEPKHHLQPPSLTLCVFTLFSVMLKLSSSVVSRILVLELDTWDVNGKHNPTPPPSPPPFLLSCPPKRESSAHPKPCGQNSEGCFGLLFLDYQPCCWSCCSVLWRKPSVVINTLWRWNHLEEQVCKCYCEGPLPSSRVIISHFIVSEIGKVKPSISNVQSLFPKLSRSHSRD